jgi:hypothetical protein
MGFKSFQHLLTIQGTVSIRVDGIKNLLQLLLLVLVGEVTCDEGKGGLFKLLVPLHSLRNIVFNG